MSGGRRARVTPMGYGMGMVDSAVCARCDALLPESEDGLGPKHALVVRFDGGYGMFCDPDPFAEEDWAVVLCHDCGHQLTDFLGMNADEWHQHRGQRAWNSDHHGH